jgi:FimV-like protein
MITPSKQVFSNISKLSAALIISGLTFYSGATYADQAYGPVRSNDTLSKIVNRYYVGPKRSPMNLMLEIVEKNPQAFVRGNMNLLKKNALLSLPGNDWLSQEATFISPDNAAIAKLANTLSQTPAKVNQKALSNKLGIEDRLIFLEAERTSLIAQVSELKRDNARLLKKVSQLELASKESDEQLRLLDAEIIRVTKLLGNNEGLPLSVAGLSQVEALQKQLNAVNAQTENLRSQLEATQIELADNLEIQAKADKTIAQLTLENEQLNALVEEGQPGVHYFGDAEGNNSISLFSGKFKLPMWSLVAGGALLSLVLVALLSTRRKESDSPFIVDEESAAIPESYDDLLESDGALDGRGFTQNTVSEPEENVYKMFDEGSLEMDLKLDMAKAYLEVSDFEAAKSVLEEVIEGGSELQQRQANRLMKEAA